MATSEALQKPLLRDQRRALHAYDAVGQVPEDQRDAYAIVVNSFGANIRYWAPAYPLYSGGHNYWCTALSGLPF